MALVAVDDLREELQDIMQRAIQAELGGLKELFAQAHGSAQSSDGCDQVASIKPPAKLIPEAYHGALPREVQSRDSSRQLALLHSSDQAFHKPMPFSSSRGPLPMSAELASDESTHVFRLQTFLLTVTETSAFEWASAGNVVLNAAWIGFQTDYVARHWSHISPEYFQAVDLLFMVFATVEVMMRAFALGRDYFRGPNMKWHAFDVIVVFTQIVEFIVSKIAHGTSLSGLRILKLVKILRIARIASVFPELHVLIASVVGSLQALAWTLVLILTFLYAVAIGITQLVNEHKLMVGVEHMEEHEEVLLEFYGSLDRSLISLYMIISEGIHWSELMDPLVEHISPWMKPMFVVFVGFQLFAMMNVITACFVDNALRIASKAETQDALTSMWDKIQEEVGSAGEVTLEVFSRHFRHPGMSKFLELSGSEGEEPEAVFRLIDDDASGSLQSTEFMEACAKMVGPARALQVKQLIRDQSAELAQQFDEIRARQDQRIYELQKHQNLIYSQQQTMLGLIQTVESHLTRQVAEEDGQPQPSSMTKKSWFTK